MADLPDYKFVFFNVGQGDATLISNISTQESILFDIFKSESVIKELELSNSSLKAIFISHWDEDHWKDLPIILEKLISIKKSFLLFSNYRMNGRNETPEKIKRLLKLALNEKLIALEPLYLQQENRINLLNTEIEILWPSYDEFFIKAGNNFTSAIVNIKIKDERILLLPGDATGKCWKVIDNSKLNSMIFKFPHHGGSILSSLTAKEVIKKVNPKYVVVSFGKSNKYKHPSKGYKKVETELSNEIGFYDTTNGDVIFTYDSNKKLVGKGIYRNE